MLPNCDVVIPYSAAMQRPIKEKLRFLLLNMIESFFCSIHIMHDDRFPKKLGSSGDRANSWSYYYFTVAMWSPFKGGLGLIGRCADLWFSLHNHRCVTVGNNLYENTAKPLTLLEHRSPAQIASEDRDGRCNTWLYSMVDLGEKKVKPYPTWHA